MKQIREDLYFIQGQDEIDPRFPLLSDRQSIFQRRDPC